MKTIFSFFVCACLYLGTTQAQPPDTLWTRTFGGGSDDWGESVQQTSDGGFIIVGTTYSYGAGDADIYLIKTDENGNQQWSQTFGGSAEDVGHNVKQTSDGGYIITGTTWSFGAGNDDACLIKTDSEGNLQWGKTFGDYSTDCGWDVLQTNDGGYFVAGGTRSFSSPDDDEVYLFKTDEAGNQILYHNIGGGGDDWSYSIQPTSDGGYIIVGYSFSFGAGSQDVYLIKTDDYGNLQWYQIYGGYGFDVGRSVQQTLDGGYIIVGFSNSFVTPWDDVYLIKTDGEGNQQWYQTFGGNNYNEGYSVQQTFDGGYIIAGFTGAFGAGGWDVYIIKTDGNGNRLWYQTFGGSDDDFGYSIQKTTDNGYIIAGWTKSFGVGCKDVYLIRLESDSTAVSVKQLNGEIPGKITLYPVYPNPFNAETKISFELSFSCEVSLSVYDLIGKEVAKLLDDCKDAGNYNVKFYASNLPSGIYFVNLKTADFTQTQKLLLIK